MPAQRTPSVHFARRVHHRNEADPLQRALAILGWKEEAKAASATIVWDVETNADTPFNGGEALLPHQIATKLPGMLACCRKALFAHILARQRALLPPDGPLNDGRYIPAQWALPVHREELAAHVQAAADAARRSGKPAPTYIAKPDGGSQGDGIVLSTEPCKLASWDASKERVVQQYVATPLLVDGLKFDLRLYVLVTSVTPLKAFLCREGLARFAVAEYVAPTRENLRNVHMHLTNYSLNKKADGFVASDAADGGDDGSKRTVSSVFAALKAAGTLADVDALWDEIGALVSRSLAVVRPILASAATPQPCFKLLGFDVLLDATARPWLIEINDHPSLRIDLSYDEPGQYSMNGLTSVPSPVDAAIKVPMLADALRIVGEECAPRPLPSKPRPTDDGGYLGTAFHELSADGGGALLMRLHALFERHTPAATRREEAERASTGHYASDPFGAPGPRWKGASPFASFLSAGGLLARAGAGGGGSSRAGAALQRHEVDILVLGVCGKGGSMDVLDFCEACAKVARRLWPERAGTPTAELLEALLEAHYPQVET